MRHNSFRPWIEREDLRLEQLRLDGHSARVIARLMGRSVSSIESRVKALGLPMLRRLGVYLELLSGPHSIEQVARKLSVSRDAVWAARRRLRAAGFRPVEPVRRRYWLERKRDNGKFARE